MKNLTHALFSGMHKNSFNAGMSEFDREMRRRVWCLLYAWDWYGFLFLIFDAEYC